MKINAVSLRIGNIVNIDNKLWRIVKTEHVKPGKGGAFAQVEMKAVLDNTKKNERFRSEATIELVYLDEIKTNYLYEDGSMYYFMNSGTFEEVLIPSTVLTDMQKKFLLENTEVMVSFYEEQPISITLPEKMQLEIVEADAVVKRQTATSSYKPAKLSNGQSILVPPFVVAGDYVVVDTINGTYVERVKK